MQEQNPSDFLNFALTCESVRSTRSKLKKIDFVASYFLSLSDEKDLRIASNFLSGKIFSPGTIFSDVNVGYSTIWNTVSKFHNLTNSQLSEFYLKHGDMGSAIEDWLKTKKRENKQERLSLLFNTHLTLAELFDALSELAKITGKGSNDRRQKILERIFSSIREPVEAKYLIRILGGEMRIGLVEGLVEESIAKAFSKTLRQVRNTNLVSGDVGLVAVLAKQDRLNEARITVFTPTNFMLADSAQSAELLLNKFDSRPILSEYKYDGIRAQVHLYDGKVRIFSRNLEDVTRYFPEIVSEATPIANLPIILDGEIVPYENNKPLPFQALQRRLRKLEHSVDDAPITYFAFDTLFFGKSVIDEPLSTRSKLLHSLKLGGVLDYSMQESVSSVEEIQSMFDKSKSSGFEGLVAKDPESTYTPGRRGSSWVKLKKELDTLDVVIVAAEYGHGKRAGVISDYTFAVRDANDLKVIGKAYSGLTDYEIAQMTELLKQITLHDFGYRRTVKPQVVLEVAFDAIQKSDRHSSGYALRFPRIKRIRTDKSVGDIDTLSKVEEIYNSQSVKL